MTGFPLIIAFVAAIIAMILLISKLKVHPFLAIMAISLLLAVAAGSPLTQKPELAIELMGWVVSIPVFCDSGFVILNPIRKALIFVNF